MVDVPWWRAAVIYEIYIRSFADGDGDGVGDLAGICSRLPYLRELGVDALWITPWYPSPMGDGGYDVADYREIDPILGTLAQAQRLVDTAHAHGLRVLIDLVANHTSIEHPWFQTALAARPGTPARSRYWFRDGRAPGEPPNDWRSVFGGPAWTQVPDGQWYLHLFAAEQPDLNWQDDGVRAGFDEVLRFWLDRGVDGFRIDVAHGLVKDPALPDLGHTAQARIEMTDPVPPRPYWDRDGVHHIYQRWRRLVDSYGGDRILIGEAAVSPPSRLARYLRPGLLHSAFDFEYLRCPWDATQLREVIESSLAALDKVEAPALWVLSNHDIIRHVTRYGRDNTDSAVAETRTPPVDLNRGRRRARAALLLTLALPGGVCLYQGEELGLEEVEDLPEELLQDPVWKLSNHTVRGRDGCRIPLPWTDSRPSLGFSTRPAWLPQPAHWSDLSVQNQSARPDSFLSLYRTALDLRRRYTGLSAGPLNWAPSPPGTLGFTRGSELLCWVNLTSSAIALPPHRRLLLASTVIDNNELGPDAAVWLEL
ncbi:glycoside hydrolase family 13 protein [Nocardia sp. NPDC050435]|uniref:glycoside hydrolase family 13 protein n=1 Tax=Nocardia sp. NPDC050435 TaxID=3155040 RepID=UPI003407F79C